MQHMHTTAALGFGSLPLLIEEASSWSTVERLFERHRLPISVIDNPNQRIPLAAMIHLFEDGAEIVGDRTLGLRVGMRLKHSGYGLWARYITSADNLQGALSRSNNTIQFHQSGGRISSTIVGKHIVWSYHRPDVSAGTGMQHSDHVLPPMIDLVRSYLGQQWKPDWVELDYSEGWASGKLADTLQTYVKYDRPALGVAIRCDDLLARRKVKLPIDRVVTLAELAAQRRYHADQGLAEAINDVITLRLLDGKTDLEGAARHLDMGPRTLQRALKAEGISYLSLVKRARYERALFLLRNTQASIGEIAVALGYEEFANFTRAFRQWSGATPSKARQSVGYETK